MLLSVINCSYVSYEIRHKKFDISVERNFYLICRSRNLRSGNGNLVSRSYVASRS